MAIDIKTNVTKKPVKIKKEAVEEKDIFFRQILRIGLIILTIILSIAGAMIYGVYFGSWQNSLVETVSSVVPFPIASINGKKMVYLDEYNHNNKAIRRFLENKEAASGDKSFDFASDDGLKRLAVVKKSVMGELIENKIIQILAEEKGIRFTPDQAKTVALQIINRDNKKEENMVSMNMLYGWQSDDFSEKVVLPLLYREKLEEVVKEGGFLDLETKDKLATIKSRLAEGVDFSKLAEDFSDSPSKRSGGLLPSFSLDEMPFPELKPIFDWSVGKIGDPFETDEGWHFVKLEKKSVENGSPRVEIRHILLAKKPFSTWLEEQKKEFKVKVFLPGYYWHQKMGRLYFNEDALNEFEVKFNQSYYEQKVKEVNILMNAEQK